MAPQQFADAAAGPSGHRPAWLFSEMRNAGIVGWLAAGVLALNLLIAVFIGVTMYEGRLQYEERAATMTRNLATALENEIAGIVRSSDVGLLAVIDEYAQERASGRVDRQSFTSFIRMMQSRLVYANAIRIADAAGKVLYGTDVEPGSNVDISDREYFVRLRSHDEGSVVISRPQRSRVNNQWVIVLARRIEDPDGKFAGAAFMAIAVKDLTQTLSRIDVGRKGTIALRGEDLSVIARYPEGGEAGGQTGSTTVSQELRSLIESRREGTFRSVAPHDRVERTLSYRPVAGYPFHIIVGLASEEYLAQWRIARARAFLTAAVFLFVSVSLSWLAFRYWRQLKLASEALEHQAHTDFLTGLANRRFFLESALYEIARAERYGQEVSLLLLDIDHFKRINDTYGHMTGDLVLQKLAAACTGTLREVDIMGRWGGEEFAILLPETGLARAADVAERIRRVVATTEVALAQGLPLTLTVSIGVTALRGGDDNVDMLISRADKLLYRAKQTGRNRVCVDTPADAARRDEET